MTLAEHRLLMLDYDGTLAPFRVNRARAQPLRASLALLHRIAGGGRTRLAIVSGRPLPELESFLGTLPATLVGEHGWALRLPNGAHLARYLPPEVRDALDRAERDASALGWGPRLERKRTSLVLHTRGLLAPEAACLHERALALWRPLVRCANVVVDVIAGGVEVRAHARHKGTLVLSLASQAPAGTLGVYVGDDVTDEDAFDAVRDWGFGVRVGRPDVPSRALGHLTSCRAVPRFLRRWIDLTETRGSDGR